MNISEMSNMELKDEIKRMEKDILPERLRPGTANFIVLQELKFTLSRRHKEENIIKAFKIKMILHINSGFSTCQTGDVTLYREISLPFVPNKEIDTEFYSASDIDQIFFKDDVFNLYFSDKTIYNEILKQYQKGDSLLKNVRPITDINDLVIYHITQGWEK